MDQEGLADEEVSYICRVSHNALLQYVLIPSKDLRQSVGQIMRLAETILWGAWCF